MKNKGIRRILICYFLLVAVGLLSIYSVDPLRAEKQLTWFGISVAVGIVVLFVIKPYLWEVFSFPSYLMIAALLAITIFMGTEINGSKSWLKFGSIGFQPCELAKITTSLMLAHILRVRGSSIRKMKGLLFALAVLALPMLLVLAEKETGTVLVFTGFFFVLYREGFSGWYLALAFLLIVLFICAIRFEIWVSFIIMALVLGANYIILNRHGIKSYMQRRRLNLITLSVAILGTLTIFSTNFFFSKVLKEYQRERIEVMLGIKEDPMGVGYNVNQSMIAIGSGGWNGKGFGQGTQTAYGFVPEQCTDFIFCTIGEEFGFVGCVVLISLFVILISLILKNAEESRDPFNRIYGYCIASIFFMHMFINIGMTIKIMPVIGIPLPFISYGGTSLLSFSTMLFIFLALIKQEKRYW